MTKAELLSVVEMYFPSRKPKPKTKRKTLRKTTLLAGAGLGGISLGTALNLKIGNAGLAYGGTAVCVPPLAFMLLCACAAIGLVSFIHMLFS